MDLKTFVSETLTQIVAGIQDAQRQIGDLHTNAMVNPTLAETSDEFKHAQERDVDFDVALTIREEAASADGTKAGGSIGILAVVGVKASAEITGSSDMRTRNESVSRVRFSVKLAQPAQIKEYTRDDSPAPSMRTPWAR